MNDDTSLASMIFALDQGNVVRVITIGALFGATVALLQNVDLFSVLAASVAGALLWGSMWKLFRTRRTPPYGGERHPEVD